MLIWFKLDYTILIENKLNMLCAHVQKETECKHVQKAF